MLLVLPQVLELALPRRQVLLGIQQLCKQVVVEHFGNVILTAACPDEFVQIAGHLSQDLPLIPIAGLPSLLKQIDLGIPHTPDDVLAHRPHVPIFVGLVEPFAPRQPATEAKSQHPPKRLKVILRQPVAAVGRAYRAPFRTSVVARQWVAVRVLPCEPKVDEVGRHPVAGGDGAELGRAQEDVLGRHVTMDVAAFVYRFQAPQHHSTDDAEGTPPALQGLIVDIDQPLEDLGER
mmetsp:Transcript_64725/g.138677  ORF Transcript_64725/g.138677 Transcript_64725/m.138677 type:complete len:234 (-) Transcript_64725:196-897(-)